MDRTERISTHYMDLGPNYSVDPHRHLKNQRDLFHYEKVLEAVERVNAKTVLDVGCFDGWLDFLLIEKGYNLTGVELIPSLVEAGLRYALNHHITDYMIHMGFFEDLDFTVWEKFDTVICLETLEHVDLELVPVYIDKMESLSLKSIFISLPDQDHLGNRQHLWTPTEKLIRDLWGKKRNFSLDYHSYNSSHVPPNWLISYEV